MEFLVRYAKARPDLDLAAIGAIGHSYGAQAVLAWRALHNSSLGAVVSLDSTVDHNAVDEPGFAPLKARLANASRLAGPIFIYGSQEQKPDFVAHWSYLKYTRLYTAAVPDVEDNDFITQGAARFAFLPGRRVPPEKAVAIRAAYDRVCLRTREFFDAHLKGDKQAEASLEQAAQSAATGSGHFALTIHQPSASPPTAGQLVGLALRESVDAAIQLARRFGPDISEETLGDAGFGLRAEGKAAWEKAFQLLRCELFPSSWVAQKLLADTLLEEGDRGGALEAYRQAEKLIGAGSKPPPSERARKSIASGIERAQAK